MPERYAARIDANGDTDWIIVIPDTAEAEAYCAALGLSGTWRPCASLPGKGWRYHEGGYYPHWRPISGADLGDEGAESGYPVGWESWHDGAVWVSRVPFNVTVPTLADPTGWGRADGVYTIPAGWQYQPGEDITEDGETWFRVVQATGFRPSESPAQFVQIDGPGGEPVTPPEPEGPQPWVQPTGAHDAFQIGDRVTHNGATWESNVANNVWEPGVYGWIEVAA